MVHALAREAHARTRGEVELDDLVQEAAIAAWRASQRVRKDAPEKMAKAYLRRAIRNALHNLRRGSKRHSTVHYPGMESREAATDGGIEMVELGLLLERYVESLPLLHFLVLHELVAPSPRAVKILTLMGRRGEKRNVAAAVAKALGLSPRRVRTIRKVLRRRIKADLRPAIRRPRS